MVEKKIFIPVDHIFYANWKNKLMKKNVLCNFKAKKKIYKIKYKIKNYVVVINF